MIRNLGNLFEMVGGTAIEMFGEAYAEIKKNIGKIVLLLQILIPVYLAKTCEGIFEMLYLSCIWVFILALLRRIDWRVNRKNKDGLPLPPCRLTEANEDMVYLIPDREEEAVIYLNELEEYLKRRKLIENVEKPM
jgi:hypothetical protein